MRQIHETEFPNSVEATEQLLIEQGVEYAKLKVSKKLKDLWDYKKKKKGSNSYAWKLSIF